MAHIVIRDDTGVDVSLREPPRRIVSLVPSLTETLVLMGAGDLLVGVTRYCIHPRKTLAGIPRVGGTKNPSIDRIISLDPDIVIANVEENEKADVEELRKRVPVFVTYPRSVEGAIETVLALGRITGTGSRAEVWAQDCREIIESSKAARPSTDLRTACLIWKKPWMAAGTDTYMSALLEVYRFKNVFAGTADRYPRTSLDELAALEPDIVILPDEPYRFGPEHKRELERFFGTVPGKPRVLLADGAMLAWFGWRTLEALLYVQALRARVR
jgi:ABC-type Fe3+-hydroxamate transport system substrate-binding protein